MSGRAALGVAAVASGGVTFALALRALLPGVAFWDTAEFQTVGPLLGTAHPTGFPAYVTLGWLASIALAPIGEPALRMNVLAAILAATAAALVAVLVGQLTGRALLAAAAGLLYGALPLAWGLSTHADPHGLHAVLVALVFILLLGWEARCRTDEPGGSRRTDASVGRPGAGRWLVAAAAVFGLSVANHPLTWFLVPGIALFVLAVEPAVLGRRRFVLACVGVALAVAGLLYLELPLRAGPFRAPLVYGRPDTVVGFWSVALDAQFAGVFAETVGGPFDKLGDLVRLGEEQLGPLLVVVPLGLAATIVRRPRFALLTLPAVVVTCLFAAFYTNAEIERYYLVPAVAVVAWIAILVDALLEAMTSLLAGEARRGGDPGRVRARVRSVAVELLAVGLVIAPTLVGLPDRAATVDRSLDRQAEQWLDATLGQLQPNAVVVSWWNFSTPLWYAQLVQGRRTDVRIIDDRTRIDEQLGDVSDVIDANLGRRPVYLIREPSELSTLAARYRLEYLDGPPFQPLVHIVGRREGSS